ncbi:MAG: glycerate kinase [Enterococcus sp.]
MRIVAAIDSFKGSATSEELNQAVVDQAQKQGCTAINAPIADGGEGSMEAIHAAIGGSYRTIEVPDLLFRKCEVSYLLTQWESQRIAVIESAKIIGLDLLEEPNESTVRKASSFGLGEVIKDALGQSAQIIIVTLGGSGSSDGGLGLLQSFGAKLEGSEEGNPLLSVHSIDSHLIHKPKDVQLIVAADVTSPYIGEKGAFHLFGRQKGASDSTIKLFEQQAKKISKQLKQQSGLDLATTAGAGAAGGLGGALMLLGAKMQPGFSLVSKLTNLEENIQQSDLVITGEGRLDRQTLQGKVPYGVARLAQKYHKPVVAVCGSCETELGELSQVLTANFCIQNGPVTLQEAMEKEQTLLNIQATCKNIFSLYLFEKKE